MLYSQKEQKLYEYMMGSADAPGRLLEDFNPKRGGDKKAVQDGGGGTNVAQRIAQEMMVSGDWDLNKAKALQKLYQAEHQLARQKSGRLTRTYNGAKELLCAIVEAPPATSRGVDVRLDDVFNKCKRAIFRRQLIDGMVKDLEAQRVAGGPLQLTEAFLDHFADKPIYGKMTRAELMAAVNDVVQAVEGRDAVDVYDLSSYEDTRLPVAALEAAKGAHPYPGPAITEAEFEAQINKATRFLQAVRLSEGVMAATGGDDDDVVGIAGAPRQAAAIEFRDATRDLFTGANDAVAIELVVRLTAGQADGAMTRAHLKELGVISGRSHAQVTAAAGDGNPQIDEDIRGCGIRDNGRSVTENAEFPGDGTAAAAIAAKEQLRVVTIPNLPWYAKKAEGRAAPKFDVQLMHESIEAAVDEGGAGGMTAAQAKDVTYVNTQLKLAADAIEAAVKAEGRRLRDGDPAAADATAKLAALARGDVLAKEIFTRWVNKHNAAAPPACPEITVANLDAGALDGQAVYGHDRHGETMSQYIIARAAGCNHSDDSDVGKVRVAGSVPLLMREDPTFEVLDRLKIASHCADRIYVEDPQQNKELSKLLVKAVRGFIDKPLENIPMYHAKAACDYIIGKGDAPDVSPPRLRVLDRAKDRWAEVLAGTEELSEFGTIQQGTKEKQWVEGAMDVYVGYLSDLATDVAVKKDVEQQEFSEKLKSVAEAAQMKLELSVAGRELEQAKLRLQEESYRRRGIDEPADVVKHETKQGLTIGALVGGVIAAGILVAMVVATIAAPPAGVTFGAAIMTAIGEGVGFGVLALVCTTAVGTGAGAIRGLKSAADGNYTEGIGDKVAEASHKERVLRKQEARYQNIAERDLSDPKDAERAYREARSAARLIGRGLGIKDIKPMEEDGLFYSGEKKLEEQMRELKETVRESKTVLATSQAEFKKAKGKATEKLEEKVETRIR